ncbi:VanW family protein [Corynebacterium epidermidicanis]|uniref:Putative vancomycin resistance protein n=1 Tax=Corynebacterium epidermidicanis TaxID=1050174 RepID=A0A0G3GUE0_9CORY|nr:VanW family protein [Corynebacterium epidermidicanis]AKK04120.1 putative vancomycin resistance protein [Corynebacterium epidermidicanis]
MSASRPVSALKITVGVVLSILALAVAAYVADFLLTRDHVPRGTTVAGVQIGGMQRDVALSTLRTELAPRAEQPVVVEAGERSATFKPQDAGLKVDWEKTIDAAGTPSLNPITKVTSFFVSRDVSVESDVDQQALRKELDRVHAELTPAPADARIDFADGVFVPVAPVNGQKVDRGEVQGRVLDHWLDPVVRVDAKVTQPAVLQSALDRAMSGPVRVAQSAPIVAVGRKDVVGEVPLNRMGEVVSFKPEGGELKPEVNTEAAQAILAEGLAKSEVKRRNADISFAGGKKVTPSVDGVSVEWEPTMADFAARVVGTAPKRFDAVYRDEPATFTTEQAEKATFDDVIGEFSTGGFSGPSGVNIAKTAQLVDGALVAPGETFSLNRHTGPRGTAQGFVESGIILNGHADKAVGGGISQFATTLYNAAYFAGMEDVAHTAHSYYISRYPAGREATVFEGVIDLQFKNTSAHPVLITAGVSGNEVHVALKGVKTVQVESISGGRWAPTSPSPITLSGADCAPSGGAPGFTTSDTRVIRSLSGQEISRETTTTVYDPQPIVRCS